MKNLCWGEEDPSPRCGRSPPRPAGPLSLLDGLSVAAVSLALLPALPAAAAAATTTGAAAAAAGPAAVAAAVPGAAGLADLAAVLQRGAGVRPLQAVIFQQLGLEGGQVVLAALDLCSQQHDVGAVTCFLEKVQKVFFFFLFFLKEGEGVRETSSIFFCTVRLTSKSRYSSLWRYSSISRPLTLRSGG